MTGQSQPLLRNPLAEALAAGRVALAMIVQKMSSVDIAIAAGSCGFDAISDDLEHSVISEASASQICITAVNAGITPLVRVPSHESHVMGRLLDAGALGIIAPHVESADEARAIVAACKFAPEGGRSVSYHWPQLGYRSCAPKAMRAALNAATTVVVMLESPLAIERADDIAAVPGVDILHVGSLDLADALGAPGRVDDPQMDVCFERVIAACRAHGKVAGIGGVGAHPGVARRVIVQGARFLTAGIDWDFMLAAARARVQSLQTLEN